MIGAINENRLIGELVSRFRRSPVQSNRLHETDAEIVRVSDELMLAFTTDSIAEEIACGLYADPYLAGWMAVMANLSDLAAVGATPIGLLISEILPRGCTPEFLRDLQSGIRDACEVCGTFILGGDTNAGTELMVTGSAAGVCPDKRFLSRTGCRPGDLLYSTGRLGIGNAYVLSVLRPEGLPLTPGGDGVRHPPGQSGIDREVTYRPAARLREGRSLVGLATCCMDTSDGVLATLDQLMRLNSVGFRIGGAWESSLHPQARRIAEAAGIPSWLLLAGQHGEFELLFTVPQQCADRLHDVAAQSGWDPLLLGSVSEVPRIELPLYGSGAIGIDTARIRNIAADAGNDVNRCLQKLLSIDNAIRKGVLSHEDD